MRAVEEEEEEGGRFGHYQRLITPHQPCPTVFTAFIGEHDYMWASLFHHGSEQCDKTLHCDFFYSKAYRFILWVTAVCWTARFLNFEFQIEFNFNFKSNTIRVF